jgi:hypothetical protein
MNSACPEACLGARVFLLSLSGEARVALLQGQERRDGIRDW